MFSFIEDLAKAAVGVVTIPVGVVADVITLGGTITDKEELYTTKAISDTVENLKNAAEPRK